MYCVQVLEHEACRCHSAVYYTAFYQYPAFGKLRLDHSVSCSAFSIKTQFIISWNETAYLWIYAGFLHYQMIFGSIKSWGCVIRISLDFWIPGPWFSFRPWKWTTCWEVISGHALVSCTAFIVPDSHKYVMFRIYIWDIWNSWEALLCFRKPQNPVGSTKTHE